MEGAMANQLTMNPYAPPKANVDVSSYVTTVEAFPRFSTWWVLLLTLTTFGIYPIYWLYTRTRILNRILPSGAIPIGLAFAAAGLLVASIAAELLQGIYPDDLGVSAISRIIGLICNVVILVWVFMLRNRLNEHFASKQGDRYWIGGVLTFFLHVLYLQYKLNRLIDREKNAAGVPAAGAMGRRASVQATFDQQSRPSRENTEPLANA
jgi:Domain of unknown function (DUF4234)